MEVCIAIKNILVYKKETNSKQYNYSCMDIFIHLLLHDAELYTQYIVS